MFEDKITIKRQRIMKKIVYLAPLALLGMVGMGAKASANETDLPGQKVSAFSNGQSQPAEKTKENIHISRLDVAQFNEGSKIYGLDNNNQLSKNNGDGYVITNAGTYNSRPVDIGVTVNNVQDNQGSYTTKWSNGDKADTTGKVDNQFNYQNSALVGSKVTTPQIDQTKTRTRTEKQNVNVPLSGGVWVHGFADNDDPSDPNSTANSKAGNGNSEEYSSIHIIAPRLIKQIMEQANVSENEAIAKLLESPDFYSKLIPCHVKLTDKTYIDKYYIGPASADATNPAYETSRIFYYHVSFTNSMHDSDFLKHVDQDDFFFKADEIGNFNKDMFDWPDDNSLPGLWPDGEMPNPVIDDISVPDAKFDANLGRANNGDLVSGFSKIDSYDDDERFGNDFNPNDREYEKGILYKRKLSPSETASNDFTTSPVVANFTKSVQVTDHLQLDQIRPGSLDYNYTVGLYDAKTGDLIKNVTAAFKSKAGKIATDQDTAMNEAIKAKIQTINANSANAAYTGTAANDDISFSKNTVHVNYIDEQGKPINIPGYDIDIDNLTDGNYQVPKNYSLANNNGFKVTKNTHQVNGITVTDSYNFIDQGNNRVTDNGKTISVVLKHFAMHVDPAHSGLSNNATDNVFIINNGAKKQINSQLRHFSAAGMLDLVTNKVSKQGDWQLLDKPNFDQTNINNDLVGYDNAIHSNLTFLTL